MSFGGSLFGNAGASSTTTTTPASAGGIGNIFANAANAANASKPATPSLFGTANTATPASAPSGGLFGNAQSNTSTTPAITLQPPGTSAPTTSLFGNNSTTNTAPAAGGLFGGANAAAATSAPALGAGLFGSTTGTATSSAAPSGGLFGNANATSNAPATGGLFGSSTTASTAPAAGGLFASSAAASQPAASGGLFGGAQSAATSTGLFGASTYNANVNANTQANSTYQPLFSSLGTATAQQPQQANTSQQQPQVIQGVRIDLSNVKPTTRFYELHESLQHEIIQADDFIQSQINLITQCNVFMPAHGTSLATLAPDVKFVHNALDTVALALGRDAAEINAVKGTVKQDIDDCTRAFTAIEHLKLPAPWQYSGQVWSSSAAADASAVGGGSGGPGGSGTVAGSSGIVDGENAFAATDMVPYFDRQTSELDARLKEYNSQLAEIEAHLRTVEGSAVEQMHRLLQQQQAGGNAEHERSQVAELANAMHVFEEAVLRVAGRVGETREGVIDVTLGRLYGNGSVSR